MFDVVVVVVVVVVEFVGGGVAMRCMVGGGRIGGRCTRQSLIQ